MVPCAMHEKYHCIGVDVFFCKKDRLRIICICIIFPLDRMQRRYREAYVQRTVMQGGYKIYFTLELDGFLFSSSKLSFSLKDLSM
jgi:hypothetical protein